MITTQKELRRLFWFYNEERSRTKIRDHSGNGTMYCADTRIAWIDFIDYMVRSGQISEALAQRATL